MRLKWRARCSMLTRAAVQSINRPRPVFFPALLSPKPTVLDHSDLASLRSIENRKFSAQKEQSADVVRRCCIMDDADAGA